MNKYFALLLALMMLLAGCANGDAEQADSTDTSETTLPGYYVEDSLLETDSNGAVRQYTLPGTGYRWIKSIGDRLLLATEGDTTRLHLLSGDTCIPVAAVDVEAFSDRCEAMFNGFAYYDETAHAVSFLDPQLNLAQSISLPDGSADPIISKDGNQIFYRVGNEIRAMDITRKISRLVKTLSADKIMLIGCCFDGKILICNVEDDDGNVNTLYISSENGQTLKTDNELRYLETDEDQYLVERMDGAVLQRITGTLDGDGKLLTILDTYIAAALELNCVIGYNLRENSTVLNCYDLTTGKRTASVSLQGITQPKAFFADRWSNCIWILTADTDNNGTVLLRWNTKESPVQDEANYIAQLFTANNPDTAGLDALADRISALNKKYGVRIRIWQEAVKYPGEHALVPEHHVSVITNMLDSLENVLAEFPKNFISKSLSSKVRICLVRSVDGEENGLQYWENGNAFIALSSGSDIRSEFLHAFGYVIDSHVLGNSAKYDYWDTLNPSGFMYGMSMDESLTTGDNRAFSDISSLASGTADRANVFWQAMLPDNAEMFRSETMRKKLTMLCKAIRDAWSLKKSTEIFPWEQYLEKPIAYKK